jgi:hypothetical protein
MASSFHDAAIIGAHGQGVRALVERAFPQQDLSLLLPHLSIGYVKQGETAELQPWRVLHSVKLRSPRPP